MATTTPPPRLQIAQILADLSDLNVAEPDAALAIVTAHRHLSSPQKLTRSKTPSSLAASSRFPPNSQRHSGMTPTPISTPGSLSRRFSRNDSSGSGASASASASSSRYQTPSPGAERDPDLERAQTLMHFYEIRGRFKQQENAGLARARANVEAVAERYGVRREGP